MREYREQKFGDSVSEHVQAAILVIICLWGLSRWKGGLLTLFYRGSISRRGINRGRGQTEEI